MNALNQQPATTEEQSALFQKAKTDQEFRRQLRACDPNALAQIGFESNSDGDTAPKIKVVTSTQDITYVQLPYRDLSDEPVSQIELSHLQGFSSMMSTNSLGSIVSCCLAQTERYTE